MEPSQTSSPLTEGPWGRGGAIAAEESIKLIPKIRPTTTPGRPDYVKYVGHKALTLSAPGAENAHWDFDFVASPHTRQSSFFRVAGRPMADHFLAFYNAAIIAYGQSGSGKTHTMLGNLPSDWETRNLSTGCFEDMPREAGLIPRVLGYIFQRIAAESNGGPNTTQVAGTRQLPQPPPAPAQPCTTPVADNVRSRARSGIPTPNGVPRATYLTPPPASPQGTPEAPVHAAKPPFGPSSRSKSANSGGTEYLIKASMLQIYQEVVTDLLNPRPVRLQIRESMEGGVMVVGLSEITVRSAAEALQLLRVGTSHRAVAETASNPVSSRSHCILTLHMEAKDKLDTGVVRIRRSRLQLVDLAGSERTAKGVDYGSGRQKETNAINKSLSTLGLVISRLTDRTRSQGPVPYRDSKLTFLLQDCLGGNAKTLIIANLNPSPTCALETNMTLGFALRAKRVRNRAVINEDCQGDALILQGEVRRLREELSIFRTLHAKDEPPKGIEALSVWRDEAAARVSQLHQALQLNGKLEEKLAALEAAHSRLHMEHVALEEQCEAQRCEVSALEATVEQCEDELHELRERPTVEQLQVMEEQLRAVISERDDAKAHHEDAVQKNVQLQEQCLQLSALLQTYQNRPLDADHARQSHERLGCIYNEPLLHTVSASDYAALERAYADLKQSYTALVEQNQQLLQQLEAAASTLEEASSAKTEICDGPQHKPHHRYNLADSCLVSGGLAAVMEAADEDCDDVAGDNGKNPDQDRASPAEADSPSEQMRLASPPSPGGSVGQEAGSATTDSIARLSPDQPSPAHCFEQPDSASNQMRRRCRSQGSGTDAAVAGRVVADSVVLRRSAPGLPDGLDGHRSCDSAPPAFSLTNIRHLGRLTYSGLQCEASGAILEEGSEDTAETRSLGTLVRVNPLFECRHGEERQSTAERDETAARAEAATSTPVPKSTGSAEVPVGSDSLMCELPMPPGGQLAQASPWPQGTCRTAAGSDDSDSTAGVVREGSGVGGRAVCSALSDARNRALREIQSPNTSVAATAAPAEPRRSKAGLRAEASSMMTPCSHPACANVERGSGAQPLSPSCSLAADSCCIAIGEGPASPVFKFDGFAGDVTAPSRSAAKASSVSRATGSELHASSPLLTFSVRNNENASAPFSSIAGVPQASCASTDKVLRSSWEPQLPCVTGVCGPSAQGLRSTQSPSQCGRDRSRVPIRAGSFLSHSAATSACGAVDGCGQRVSPGGALNDSPVTEQRAGHHEAGSRLREEQLYENIAQLEEELDRRLQGEMQLRVKLQEALSDAQSAKSQAANLLALNNGLIEEVTERDERLRCFEDMLARLYAEMKAILRQGLHELATPVQHTRAATTSVASPAANTALGDGAIHACSAPEDSDPATASPTERPRVMQSFETAAGSPFSYGADATPQYFIAHPPTSRRASPSSVQSHGSPGSRDADLVPSPLSLMIGSVQVDGPNSAMKTGLMMLLAKLRDGLLERDQQVAGLEAELQDARSRRQCLEQELQKLQEVCQQAASQPGADGETGPINEAAADADASEPMQPAVAVDTDRIDEHGFIAPPSPACSDSDPHPPEAWSASRKQLSQSTPPDSSTRREASLQAQLQSRDCQVFELLERNEQLEAAVQAAVADRDNRVAELQSHATRLANNLQAQLWKRDTQVTELQNQVAELYASLQRTTAEAVHYRQQSMEAVEQCERYVKELKGSEHREDLLMKKLRTLEMSFMHRGQENEGLLANLTNTAEQLAGMRAKAMAAEAKAAHAQQVAASLEDQLEDLRRNIRLVQPPPPLHRQQPPASHYVATVRPTGVSTSGAAPGAWPSGPQGSQGPYLYGSRRDGGAVGGHAMAYQVSGLTHADLEGPTPAEARPLGQPQRGNPAFGQVAPPAAPIRPVPNYGFPKGGATRGHAPAPATIGAVQDHGANKGTWVQRFLCRKGVSVDGSPGQEAHVAILTPAKPRTKGMTGIVLRQWVGNTSGKASRKVV